MMKTLFRVLSVALSVTLAALAPVQAGSLLLMGLGANGSGGGGGGNLSAPIFSSGQVAPSTTAVNYGHFAPTGHNGQSWNASTTARHSVVASTGTINNLYALATVIPTSTSQWKVTLVKNSVATALTCTITASSTASGAGAYCTDTSDNISISPGDDLTWQSDPTTADCPGGSVICPPAASLSISVEWTGSGAEAPIWAESTLPLTGGTTVQYMGFEGTGGAASSEVAAETIIPASGTIDHLYARVSAATLAAGNYTLTVNHGAYGSASASTLTCTITATANNCNDTNAGHAIAVTAGDAISVTVTPASSATTNVLSVSARFVPTTAGQYPQIANFSAPGANSTVYFVGSGNEAAGASSATNAQAIIPIGFSAKNLYCGWSAAQASGTRTQALGSFATLGNSFTASSLTNVSDTSAICPPDTTHTPSFTAGSVVELRTVSTAGATAITYGTASWVSTVP